MCSIWNVAGYKIRDITPLQHRGIYRVRVDDSLELRLLRNVVDGADPRPIGATLLVNYVIAARNQLPQKGRDCVVQMNDLFRVKAIALRAQPPAGPLNDIAYRGAVLCLRLPNHEVVADLELAGREGQPKSV